MENKRKRRTLFSRILTDFFFLNALCLLLASLVLGLYLFRYTVEQSKQKLLTNAIFAADATLSCLSEGESLTAGTANLFRSSIENISENSSSSIIILSVNQKVFYASGKDLPLNESALAGNEALHSILRRNTAIGSGTLNGLFSQKALYACYPMVQDDRTVIGIVIAAMPFPHVSEEILSVYALIMFCMLLISVALSFLLAKQISRPLHKINAAAAKVALGEYNENVFTDNTIAEISELTENFNHMIKSLHAVEDSRRSFVASVSHELRTPLTTINGFLDGIIDGTIPPEMTGHYLEICSSESKRLAKLTNELLEMSRMENADQPLQITTVDIAECLRQQIILYEEKVEEKNIDVMLNLTHESCLCLCDKDAITRVFINLLDNAFKFVNVGGTVSVSITQNKELATISVENSGKGISKEDCRNIFDKFFKGDKSRSEDRSGLGLGLYMVRNIINRHGQKIWVESEPDVYTRFTFCLPCSQKK